MRTHRLSVNSTYSPSSPLLVVKNVWIRSLTVWSLNYQQESHVSAHTSLSSDYWISSQKKFPVIRDIYRKYYNRAGHRKPSTLQNKCKMRIVHLNPVQ